MESDFRGKKIAVIGLGLIGGSLAKGLIAHTGATVYGFDTDERVLAAAKAEGAIDFALDVAGELPQMDMTFVCLFPKDTVAFITENCRRFQKNSLVLDVSGVKQSVLTPIEQLQDRGFHFLGTHPMAGKEQVGYFYSEAALFYGASMILVPLPSTPQWAVEEAKALSKELGFGQVTLTTPDHHDRVIALTSQLCHILSSAYVQSPTAEEFAGFSAGSFRDLSRVAKLNPHMWAQLFFANREALLGELDVFMDTLQHYKQALEQKNFEEMHALLHRGSMIKERLQNEEN